MTYQVLGNSSCCTEISCMNAAVDNLRNGLDNFTSIDRISVVTSVELCFRVGTRHDCSTGECSGSKNDNGGDGETHCEFVGKDEFIVGLIRNQIYFTGKRLRNL